MAADAAPDFRGELSVRIVAFLRGLGLEVRAEPVEGPTFVPGIRVERGALLVDEDRMRWPGDLLHEAGHIALVEPAARASLGQDADHDPGNEMGAIAWSYAAALHLGIDPAVVFHPEGYRGDSASLLENFAAGRTFGVPILQWRGLCRPQAEGGYPRMERWLR